MSQLQALEGSGGTGPPGGGRESVLQETVWVTTPRQQRTSAWKVRGGHYDGSHNSHQEPADRGLSGRSVQPPLRPPAHNCGLKLARTLARKVTSHVSCLYTLLILLYTLRQVEHLERLELLQSLLWGISLQVSPVSQGHLHHQRPRLCRRDRTDTVLL